VKITIKVLRDSNLYKKRAQGQKVKGKYASSDYPSIIFFSSFDDYMNKTIVVG